MNRILVTGSHGLIGTALRYALNERGFEVQGLDLRAIAQTGNRDLTEGVGCKWPQALNIFVGTRDIQINPGPTQIRRQVRRIGQLHRGIRHAAEDDRIGRRIYRRGLRN